jgi:hypothetical protein
LSISKRRTSNIGESFLAIMSNNTALLNPMEIDPLIASRVRRGAPCGDGEEEAAVVR